MASIFKTQETKRKIKTQQFKFDTYKKQYTYLDLIQRMERDGAFTRQRSYQKIKPQFLHWKERLGSYASIYITHDLINQMLQRYTHLDVEVTKKFSNRPLS